MNAAKWCGIFFCYSLSTPRSAAELIFFSISYQRCKVVQKYLLFGFLSTPQKASKVDFLIQRRLVLQNCFFSIFYQRRRLVQKYLFFGFLSTPQKASEFFFVFLLTLLSSAEVLLFGLLSTPQVASELHFFGFLSTPRSAAELVFFRFLISAARWFKNTCFLVSYQRRKRLQK